MDGRRRRAPVATVSKLRSVAPIRPLFDDVNVVVTGTGPHTVVLLHGFSDNLQTWRRVVPALAVEHQVVAIDLPGHGATTRSWTAPLLAGYADLVGEVLDALGVDTPVSLMGNSMGAAVSAVFAAAHPERVDAVVLIGMPGVTGVPITWRAAASRPAAIAMRTALRPVPIRHLQRGFGWTYAHAASPRARSIDPTALLGYSASYADRDRLFGLSGIARALLSELRSTRLDRVLPTLASPVLQVWGKHDRLVPSRHVTRSAGAIVLPGCGHCPQLDAPDLLLDAVAPFLAAHDPARPGHLTRAAGS
jgi:pimeloyl-ACP methyl ester carboxylesterase